MQSSEKEMISAKQIAVCILSRTDVNSERWILLSNRVQALRVEKQE